MNYSHIVINRLLDKYEKSNHTEGKFSNRRVLIKTDKAIMPEYDYHNDNIRDAFNNAVIELGRKNLVMIKWARKGYLLSEIWLNLNNLDNAYHYVERKTQKTLCNEYILLLLPLTENCNTKWIRDFAINQVDSMQTSSRLTPLCKRDNKEIENLIIALKYCDYLQGESITMRSFSINCYRDSKYFEKNVKDLFLSIAKSIILI